jgi:hypothetical protein
MTNAPAHTAAPKKLGRRPTVRFDTAAPLLAELSLVHLGEEALSKGLFLRDAMGRVTLVLRSEVKKSARKRFDDAAISLSKGYFDPPSATPSELFDDSLGDPDIGVLDSVMIAGIRRDVRILDRRIIGQDWDTPNFTPVSPTPVVTFFSCKGGVGRSTALAVAASAFSHAGRNVMVLDLDLEAPGLGTMLLPDTERPEFGALDYFIEQGLSDTDADFLERCIAPSPLTAGRGLVEVMPATGAVARVNPGNVLGKIGRAFIERFGEDGAELSFSAQVRHLVRRLDDRGRSDVIFVDARAGLSEGAAACVMALGGYILLFGVDTPQTFESYSYLFAQFRRFVQPGESVWRQNLRAVNAKATRAPVARQAFNDKFLELFAENIYEEAGENDVTSFNYDVDDPSAPHFAWPIPFDAEFMEFDPPNRVEQLSREFFEANFGRFVDALYRLVFKGERQDAS